MSHRTVIGALALAGVGVVLGATLFRSDVAKATGIAQRGTVAASDGQPVKGRSSSPGTRSLTLEYFNGADDEKFTPIRASLMTIQGDTFGHVTWVYLLSEGTVVMYFYLQPSERVVLPLPKPLKVDEVELGQCFGSSQCFAQVNITS